MISVALKTPLETKLGICIYKMSLLHRPDNYISVKPNGTHTFYNKIAPINAHSWLMKQKHIAAQYDKQEQVCWLLDDILNLRLAKLIRNAALTVLIVYAPGLWSGFSTYLHSQIYKHNESLVERQMIKMWWIESIEQPFIRLCSASNIWTPACKWQLDFSCSAKRTLTLDQSENPSMDTQM